jgi:hypothetical protein
MLMRIWGARGSIPTPMTTAELRERLKTALTQSQGIDLSDPAAIERHIERLPTHVNTVISGNTSCVELRVNDQRFILDMGSGLKLLGEAMMQERFTGQMHIFMSHLHLDHIEGYPFFVPAFIPGNHLHFYSPRDDLEKHLRAFMDAPYFPVDLDYQAAQKSFHAISTEDEQIIAGVSVRLLELDHPGNPGRVWRSSVPSFSSTNVAPSRSMTSSRHGCPHTE